MTSPSYSTTKPSVLATESPAYRNPDATYKRPVRASALAGLCAEARIRCEWPGRGPKCEWFGDDLTRDEYPGNYPKKCHDCRREGAPERGCE
jgi:hypothetical protein